MSDHWSKFVQYCLVYGSFSKAKNVEKLKVVITPKCKVTVSAEGIQGDRCHQVTAGMERALGAVVADQPTEEMYQTAANENIAGH